jgi:hypothetical protein
LDLRRRKWWEARGGQHNEKVHNLYASPHIIRVIESGMIWVGHVARMGEMRNVYSILVRKPEGRNR